MTTEVSSGPPAESPPAHPISTWDGIPPLHAYINSLSSLIKAYKNHLQNEKSKDTERVKREARGFKPFS